MPRQMTQAEVQRAFMEQLRALKDYWARLPGQTDEQRVSGMVFSVLVMLDGHGSLPAFELVPSPHPRDRASMASDGENWWPELPAAIDEAVTVHGKGTVLHELWCQVYDTRKGGG